MAEERDEDQFNQTKGKARQQLIDQQRQPGDLQTPETMSGDRNLGGQNSSGEADAETLQADRETGDQGADTPTGSPDQGFIGSRTGESDFAEQGQGATEDDSDIETGQPARSQNNDAGSSSGAE